VALVSQYWYDRGGTEVLARNLAAALEKCGDEVVLLYLDVANRPAVERAGMPGTVAPAGAWQQAMRVIEDWGADEVVYLLDLRNGLTEPISRFPGSFRTTIYVNINNAEALTIRGDPALAEQLRATIGRFDRVAVFFEGSVASQVLRDWGVRYRVAGTGIPPVGVVTGDEFRRRHGISPSETVLLCVGLIAPLKFQVEMLRQMPPRTGQRLVFVGDIYTGTPDYGLAFGDAVLARTDCLWLDGVSRHEVLNAMAASDLLLFPSQSEGAPLVLLESMAMGLPWITTSAIDFARELQGGVIIPLAGFQPAVDALMQAQSHREQLKRDGRAAQGERWNLDRTAATFRSWFAEDAHASSPHAAPTPLAGVAVVDTAWGDIVDGDGLVAKASALAAGAGATWMVIADGPTALTASVQEQFTLLASVEHDVIIFFRKPPPKNATAAAIAEWISAGVVAFFVRGSWYAGQTTLHALRRGMQPSGVWMADAVARLTASGRCYLAGAVR
jgi:glycosyltransferase involved in cell wall biosynthesis